MFENINDLGICSRISVSFAKHQLFVAEHNWLEGFANACPNPLYMIISFVMPTLFNAALYLSVVMD
jgi:hypothetical protein